jgi:hypothetical protein
MARKNTNRGSALAWGIWALSGVVSLIIAIHGSEADAKVGIFTCMAFGLGVAFFFTGFKTYRNMRELEDTPRVPIRGVPMGLVQVRGKACGNAPLESPVWKKPCHLYKVNIERWKRDGEGGSWEYFSTQLVGQRFYLDDGTGKVLVDPEGAECDLTPYPSSITIGLPAGLPDSSGVVRGRYQLTEFLVLPDHVYDVIGTCTESPYATDEHDRNMITKGGNDPTFAITWQTRRQKGLGLRRAARWRSSRRPSFSRSSACCSDFNRRRFAGNLQPNLEGLP